MVLQLTDFTSEITDEELREFTSEYYIPFALHPVVPAASASIADFPEGKVGVYTRFFEFANQRVPLSLFIAPAGRPFRCVSDISELRLQEHWYMLVLVTSGDARSSYMISRDAKSWVCVLLAKCVLEIANQSRNGNVVTALAEGNDNGINEEEAGIQSTHEEFEFMAAADACEETERANSNCTLENNLQQASTSGTQYDKALVYDLDGSAEVHLSENCYNNDIFSMFTQEDQYTELLEPIPEPHQVQQNDSNVIYVFSSMEQGGGTVEHHSVTVEETRAYHESLFHNIAAEVERVNLVNRKLKETNVELTTELARYKNQVKCFEISQEKYDKLERCYQKSVYQEQCLTKKINALHLSSGKQITVLNEEISNLNKQLSKEKSTVSSLQEEKKRLKSDFKIREDELLDKQIQLENKIKELDNILVKTGQSIQTMHMLSPKPDSFYHSEHKMPLGYQNPFYLKQAQQKQQSLYNGKVLLEKHDPPDSLPYISSFTYLMTFPYPSWPITFTLLCMIRKRH
ncbi:hypothetical protein Tco_1501160 [Tanacetum coccineum]